MYGAASGPDLGAARFGHQLIRQHRLDADNAFRQARDIVTPLVIGDGLDHRVPRREAYPHARKGTTRWSREPTPLNQHAIEPAGGRGQHVPVRQKGSSGESVGEILTVLWFEEPAEFAARGFEGTALFF